MRFHLIIFKTFRDVLQTRLLLQKLGREITCDRITVLAICTFFHSLASINQVSFHLILFYTFSDAPNKLFNANIKGSNSVNTGARVMVLAYCNSPYSPLSVSSFIKLSSILRDLLRDKCVCVEVLRHSQPNGVMSSAVSLPNHTFTGQA